MPVARHGSLFGIVPRADLTRMKLASSDEVRLVQAPPRMARASAATRSLGWTSNPG